MKTFPPGRYPCAYSAGLHGTPCPNRDCTYNRDFGRVCNNPSRNCIGFKPVESGWIEAEIVEEVFKIKCMDGVRFTRHWQSPSLLENRDFRRLPGGRILTVFGGWWYRESGSWTNEAYIPVAGPPLIPSKIRFWAERQQLDGK